MGVTGLWNVVQPCARPTNISTLNRKRLAVDASIWIYQFLKAVRDKEGNALRNSHVVGFFRRICKLLFHGIKPVFIFDGGAPSLKRSTIAARKRRREGRREDAVRTAGKLLAVQMQRRAEEEAQKRREEIAGAHNGQREDEPLPDQLIYVDELQLTPLGRQRNKTFKKRDQYDLPDLDVSLAEMGAPNDPRIMSLEELELYARQFDRGEDINVYDFSKIDFDSSFFVSLPASDQYNILNAARLRSRLRMGYSKEQLDVMFPNRMEFSKFQIERVRERNELTQRLMHLNGMNGEDWRNTSGRVAGEKGREYVLVKNDGVEGGWALGVVTSKEEGQRNKPIDVDIQDKIVQEEDGKDSEDEDEEFEDIPVEGLNRLPKVQQTQIRQDKLSKDMTGQGGKLFHSRQMKDNRKKDNPKTRYRESNYLFVEDSSEEENAYEHDDVQIGDKNLRHQDYGIPYDAEEDLQRAIAISLQSGMQDTNLESEVEFAGGELAEYVTDDYNEVFRKQTRVGDAKPFGRGSAQAIARIANSRSSRAIVSVNSEGEEEEEEENEDEEVDIQAALQASKKSDQMTDGHRPNISIMPTVTSLPSTGSKLFNGPLPFETLDFGSSLLGKKKCKTDRESEGGFMREDGAVAPKKAVTPPPWFSTDVREGLSNQNAMIKEYEVSDKLHDEEFRFVSPKRPASQELIDLGADEFRKSHIHNEVIEINDDNDDSNNDESKRQDNNHDIIYLHNISESLSGAADGASERERISFASTPGRIRKESRLSQANFELHNTEKDNGDSLQCTGIDVYMADDTAENSSRQANAISQSDSAEEDFEDVPLTGPAELNGSLTGISLETNIEVTEAFPDINEPTHTLPVAQSAEEEPDGGMDDVFSDPEDEDLFKALANEAEEHARFASTLNNKPAEENALDYERELRQLRNQQKRDRRDADEVTQTMIAECQQLLSLFGLPYITAPMEAEAQCAELFHLGLVDGIVTDDSDIFLFGGTRVYKNMFNQAKFVECYLMSDLESEFSLTRDKLIAIAQLLGSDYTEGLPGVGPVTALEIVSEFGGLETFKMWWDSVQNGTRAKADDQGIPFRRKFRKNATKIFLPPSFPDSRVREAYLHPEVDSDATAFVWGVPDLDALRAFLMSTVGWSQARTDEILVPVIKDMNKRDEEGTQSNITSFFAGNVGAGAFAPRLRMQGKSKRMAAALTRLAVKEKANASLHMGENADAEDSDAADDEHAGCAKSNKRMKTWQ